MNKLVKVAGMVLVGIGVSSVCFAWSTPEIDPASGMNALALLTGALLIIRARRR
ncbi:MAG TPA: VPEID-CTERM sorting domain-containing protein [Bryobacteraceae bacterium]|nr:VPEID-CTERM sorting domain-containing protein [Bryobacteraceae bacterium]